jgi:hypothetical protein
MANQGLLLVTHLAAKLAKRGCRGVATRAKDYIYLRPTITTSCPYILASILLFKLVLRHLCWNFQPLGGMPFSGPRSIAGEGIEARRRRQAFSAPSRFVYLARNMLRVSQAYWAYHAVLRSLGYGGPSRRFGNSNLICLVRENSAPADPAKIQQNMPLPSSAWNPLQLKIRLYRKDPYFTDEARMQSAAPQLQTERYWSG